MKGSKTGGYSALRTWGNYGFNWLFSLVAREKKSPIWAAG